MADTTKPTDGKVVSDAGDHDRIVGLSIRKDGTLDQHDPEIIGDVDRAVENTKAQFVQMAVAKVDAEKRAELGLAGSTEQGDKSDAKIDELRKAHEAAASAAEKHAESVVKSLAKS